MECGRTPSFSHKLVVRLFLAKSSDLSTWAILDSGSGPKPTSRQKGPDDTRLQQLDELAFMFHYLNGGWLPIVDSVCLGVTLGGQNS